MSARLDTRKPNCFYATALKLTEASTDWPTELTNALFALLSEHGPMVTRSCHFLLCCRRKKKKKVFAWKANPLKPSYGSDGVNKTLLSLEYCLYGSIHI